MIIIIEKKNMNSETHPVQSVLFLCGLFGCVLLHNQACQDVSSNTQQDSVETQQLLHQITTGVLIPQLNEMKQELSHLYTKLIEYQENPTMEQKYLAQANWKQAMNIWQTIEVMQFGPLANSLNSSAGEDLRDEIYSWPTTNPCRIDQKTATEEFRDPEYFSSNLVNAYGLDALEHVLFADTGTICPPQISPVSDGLWDSLGEETIRQNRIDFALILTEELQNSVQEVLNRWEPTQGNFSHTFVQGSYPYSSVQESLSDVFQSLFYIEVYTKEKKLAIPLGIHDCSSQSCIEALEGYISQRSLDSILSNIQGFEMIFTGGEGYGFDDLLHNKGHADLSQRVLDAIENALQKGHSLQYPLNISITEEKEAVFELYEAIDSISNILKNEVSLILSLSIPVEAAGDND